jgi:hypothetical protein
VAHVAGGRRGVALVGDGEGPGRDAPRHGAGGVKGGVRGEAAEARAPMVGPLPPLADVAQ